MKDQRRGASLASTSHDSILSPCLLDAGQITHFAILLDINHEVPVLHVVASAPLRHSRYEYEVSQYDLALSTCGVMIFII